MKAKDFKGQNVSQRLTWKNDQNLNSPVPGLSDLRWPFTIFLESLAPKKTSGKQKCQIQALSPKEQFPTKNWHFGSLCMNFVLKSIKSTFCIFLLGQNVSLTLLMTVKKGHYSKWMCRKRSAVFQTGGLSPKLKKKQNLALNQFLHIGKIWVKHTFCMHMF